DSLKEELADFVDCVRHKKRPLVAGEEGRAALELALRIAGQIRNEQ
ncbi:MAG: gfo/Idh/MocA family oxidoreductase, partial [Candidatus Omnitrophica bacterium]|nr:gfo/Idh/MocA family oxidoreductase [Candidatus Omnitrophota bacterium]